MTTCKTRKRMFVLSGAIVVWTALAAMAIDPACIIPLQGNTEARGIAVGDLNGDGNYEILSTVKVNVRL